MICAGGGVYVSFAGLGEDNELLARAAPGGNDERLRAIKRRCDAHNCNRCLMIGGSPTRSIGDNHCPVLA